MERILVIDDDPLALSMLELILKFGRGDQAVEAVNSAEAALLLTAVARFDAIVSDIHMPGLNGFELLHEAKEQGITAPVILVTGDDDYDLHYQALQHGAFEVLQKPISPTALLTAVADAVARGRSDERAG
ncbi:response regulator [Candidatus Nitrospira bockiana]